MRIEIYLSGIGICWLANYIQTEKELFIWILLKMGTVEMF